MFPPYLTAAVSQSLQKEEGLVSPLHCWWSSLFLEVSTSNPTGNQLNIASTLLQKKTAWCKHIHVCHISHNNGAYLMCSLHLKPTCTCHQIIVVEVISTTMLFFFSLIVPLYTAGPPAIRCCGMQFFVFSQPIWPVPQDISPIVSH